MNALAWTNLLHLSKQCAAFLLERKNELVVIAESRNGLLALMKARYLNHLMQMMTHRENEEASSAVQNSKKDCSARG